MRVELHDTVRVRAIAVSGSEPAESCVTPTGRRARLLIARLALADGSVSAQSLAEVLWPEALPPTWPVALRGTVGTLRAALAPIGGDAQRVIATVPGGYRLAADVEVDVLADRTSVHVAEGHARDGRHRAVRALAAGPAGRRGERLVAGEDAAWLTPHRAAVDRTALRAAELVIDAAAAEGDHRDAVELARRLVADRPLDEPAHRLLVVALDRAGDRAEAIRAYEACRAMLADELGVDPGADTVAAYLHAVQDTATSVARLPRETSSFVGRDEESARLRELLLEPGLVSVVGPGGVGKSRLVLQTLTPLDPPGGRYWVGLGAVCDDELVAGTVALNLGVRIGTDDPTDALCARLAPDGRAVLVLDGCESIRDGAASLTAALVAAAPLLTVVVTSRVPLGVDGERLLTTASWPGTDEHDLDALAADPQVRLLLDRVHADGGSLVLDTANAGLVAALCRRCAGLPLALELAAAQLVEMPVGDLLDQFDSPDPGGSAGDGAATGAGTGLRAMTRTAHAALGPDEAVVFARLGVLDGPVGLPLVRAVVAGPDVAPIRVVRIMRELGARGLVTVDRSGPRWTYQQDDDVHRFARELLADDGGERLAFDRLTVAIRSLLPDDAARPPASFAAEVTSVLGSVRSLFGAALDGRADVDGGLEIAFRLHRYWTATAVSEGRFWLSRLLAAAGSDSPWRRYATYALGYLSYWSADTEDALRDLRAAIAMFGDEPDPCAARALIYVAGLLDDTDRPAEALAHVRRAMSAAQPFGTDLYVAAAMGIGSLLSERGDAEATRYAAEAVARCRVDGSADQLAVLLPTAAMIAWQVGAFDEARAYAAEAVPLHSEHRRIARVVLLAVRAGLALGDGDPGAALDFSAAADDEASALGVDRELALIRCIRARAMLTTGDLAGAADRTSAALDVAAAGSVQYPLAIGLETAALVAAAAGGSGAMTAKYVAGVLAASEQIRAAGDRPAPVALRAAIDDLRARVGGGEVPPDLLAAARSLLHDPSFAPA